MKSTYFDLIDQTYYFPQDGFDLHEGELSFHGVSIMHLIRKYGTPFKLTYLPRIGEQIKRAKNLFNRSIKQNGYKGKYYYCYCTKCCHFEHVIKKALEFGVHLETSSSFDIDIIYKLYKSGDINNNIIIVHNGYKTDEYLENIVRLQKDGFKNSIVVLDSMSELDRLNSRIDRPIKVGIRMAINEEPQSAYYTSRLGVRPSEIIDFYEDRIAHMENITLTMMHFFVDTGIKDTLYYWGEFKKAISLYTQLKKKCKTLDSLNIGGGFPIRNNLGFEYDYKYMIGEIVRNIKEACESEGIDDPHIFTEFGKYTVGESGATIFTVLEEKMQNDAERWYMIDNSLINTIPDAWGIFEKFILLPINKWNEQYYNVNIGGISCDHSDYYNSEDLNQQVFMPAANGSDKKEPLYVGFFHTGAYQDAISGYGGIKHCLIPSPKTIVIDRDSTGNYVDYVFRQEQTADEMMKILGY
ncbi:arginine decarboxylase [Membranihabitans maritimus]|uniref:arginine decarboxylase n=1 Tax=Membranihabitans maritimus TaxID=2904244 RepID=UPI001F197C3E|nr:arginine decarboxylase [Membranihabitans maritimus]